MHTLQRWSRGRRRRCREAKPKEKIRLKSRETLKTLRKKTGICRNEVRSGSWIQVVVLKFLIFDK